MHRIFPAALILVLAAAACTPAPQAGRAALCPARDVSHLVGQRLVDVAASADIGPLRHLPAQDPAGAARPDRLTLQSDGAGRVAAAWCG